MILHLQVHMDSTINGEIITDSRLDVGRIIVVMMYLKMQHELLKLHGILATIITDITDIRSLCEVQIIGHEISITIDYGDEVEIMLVITGD